MSIEIETRNRRIALVVTLVTELCKLSGLAIEDVIFGLEDLALVVPDPEAGAEGRP